MSKKRGRDDEVAKPTEKKQKSVVQQGVGLAGVASYEGFRPQPLFRPPPTVFDAEVAGLMREMSLS